MTRRIDVRIDRVVLHGIDPGDRTAYAAALRRTIADAVAAQREAVAGDRDIATIDAGRAAQGAEAVAVAQAITGAMAGRVR